MNRRSIQRIALTVAALCGAGVAQASSVSAGSGMWAARNDTASGSNTWRFGTPTAADTITWTSGANTTDGVGHAQDIFGPEPKFTTAPALAGRTFTGFTDNDGPGPSGSTTSTNGSGSSLPVPGTLWGTNWRANWTLNASGSLGRGAGASWSSQAEALDPLNIFASQLSGTGVTSSKYDLFFAVGLDSATLSSGGGAGLKVSYEDASRKTTLLDVSLGSSGATVTGSSSASFYLLSSLTEGPTEISGHLKSLSQLQAAFGDGGGPVYLGVVLEDLPVPTATLSNGALAAIHIDSRVSDVAAIPEPNTWLLLSAGGLLMWVRLARREREQR